MREKKTLLWSWIFRIRIIKERETGKVVHFVSELCGQGHSLASGYRHCLLPVKDGLGQEVEGGKDSWGVSASLSRIMEGWRDLCHRNCPLFPLQLLSPDKRMREELLGSEAPSSGGKLNQKQVLIDMASVRSTWTSSVLLLQRGSTSRWSWPVGGTLFPGSCPRGSGIWST